MLRKINARDIVLQVLAADATTWVEVAGLNSVTVNPGENEETADTTTYASQGAYEQEVMQRGASLVLEGFLLKDDSTGVQDPGQARVEVVGAAVAEESVGQVRFRHPVDTLWKVWNCTVSLAEQGGGNNDKTGWGATITRSGASTTMAVA
ncbi:MAG: phage tail tube protein [Streptomyces sp.]